MAKQPWVSTDAAALPPEDRPLTWSQALASPCATCNGAPCCTYLPLHSFPVNTLFHLDHARYLLGFERIELGISAGGKWSAFYRHPCRFLDRETFLCRVHEQPEQPRICKHFNPYACWYRQHLRTPLSEGYLRVDRPRLEFILAHTTFDDDRNILEVPSWESLTEAFRDLPVASPAPDDAQDDPVFDRWHGQVIAPEALTRRRAGQKPDPAGGQPEQDAAAPHPVPAEYSYDELGNPCTGCEAYCCTTLLFPHDLPRTAPNLDYLQFCLGFPGIDLGVSDSGWQLIVKTTCRHLTADHRCGIYGAPERPLICTYYDAARCTYKGQIGEIRPEGFVRVRLSEFAALASCFRFDADGRVVAFPRAEAIRDAIEAGWRADRR